MVLGSQKGLNIKGEKYSFNTPEVQDKGRVSLCRDCRIFILTLIKKALAIFKAKNPDEAWKYDRFEVFQHYDPQVGEHGGVENFLSQTIS